MAKVIKKRAGPPVPAQDTNLTLQMIPVVKAVEGAALCKRKISGIFWQDCTTGKFDVSTEIQEYLETIYHCGDNLTCN